MTIRRREYKIVARPRQDSENILECFLLVDGKVHYSCFGDKNTFLIERFARSYCGFLPPIELVPAGTQIGRPRVQS